MEDGFELVSGGSDNHLILCDLSNKGVPGKVVSKALDKANIVLNCNSVPFDKRKPFDPSGIRIGTSAITSRGMGESEMKQIATWISQATASPENEELLSRIAGEVKEFCGRFPAPGLLQGDNA